MTKSLDEDTVLLASLAYDEYTINVFQLTVPSGNPHVPDRVAYKANIDGAQERTVWLNRHEANSFRVMTEPELRMWLVRNGCPV